MAVALFGGIQVAARSQDENQQLTRKTRLVLAAISLAEDQGITRAALTGWIWPDRSETQARSSLRQALSAIRKALPDILPGYQLLSDNEMLVLSGPSREIDTRQFRSLVTSLDPHLWAGAARIYRGELLPGVEMPDTMENMVTQIRRQFHQQALALVEKLSMAKDLSASDAQACVDLANQLLTNDPAAEEAHRAIIRIKMVSGQINAARKQFEICSQEVKRAFDTVPERQTYALLDGISGKADTRSTSAGAETGYSDGKTAGAKNVLARPAVLFLPFESLSNSPDDALLALGLCEDIRTNLSCWRSFPVIGSEALGGQTGDIQKLAASVEATYAVTGSVRRFGDRARVVARLIDGTTGREIWSQTFDGQLEDVFDFQDRISQRIVSQIEPAISQATAKRIRVSRSKDLTAWELIAKAVDAERRGGDGYGTPEANNAQKMFVHEAIELDPEHCEAWARLGRCYFREFLMGWVEDPNEALRQSLDASARAIEIDPNNSIAQAFRAQSILFGKHDPRGAFDHAFEAVRLNPSNVMGHYMMGCTLVYCGEPESAFEHYETVLRLNPSFFGKGALYCDQMMCRALTGNLEEATNFARKTIDIAPNYLRGLQRCASVFAHAGLMDDARASLKRIDALDGSFDETYLRNTYPFIRSEDLQFLVDGLRKAGWSG